MACVSLRRCRLAPRQCSPAQRTPRVTCRMPDSTPMQPSEPESAQRPPPGSEEGGAGHGPRPFTVVLTSVPQIVFAGRVVAPGGFQPVRLHRIAQNNAMTRKTAHEPHWVTILVHASAGLAGASAWPARYRRLPAASCASFSTIHHFNVRTIDASPLPTRTAPRNGSLCVRSSPCPSWRPTIHTTATTARTDSRTNQRGNRIPIATRYPANVTSCGHVWRTSALQVAFTRSKACLPQESWRERASVSTYRRKNASQQVDRRWRTAGYGDVHRKQF